MNKNFRSLEAFTEHVADMLSDHVLETPSHTPYVLQTPLFVWCFNYGSMVYHSNLAKDYDVCIIVSHELRDIVASVLDSDTIKSYLINGYPIDVKMVAYSDMDVTELLELDYAIKTESSCYKPMILGLSQGYIKKDSMECLPSLSLNNKKYVRHSISQKCSNSFVKAKKKLTVEKDYDRYSSMKSLFHSIRMARFAYDYGKNGIINPSACTELYLEIKKDYDTHTDEEILELIGTKYKKIYNDRMSLFRLLYPK